MLIRLDLVFPSSQDDTLPVANKSWIPRKARPQFTGYSHVVRRLKKRLTSGENGKADSRQTVFVISGMGGVGKSETVLQFLKNYSGR